MEYNYIYYLLDRYSSEVNGMGRGSPAWQEITQHYASQLYNDIQEAIYGVKIEASNSLEINI